MNRLLAIALMNIGQGSGDARRLISEILRHLTAMGAMAFSVFSGHVVTVHPSIARVGLIIRLGSNIIIPHTVFASVGLWVSGSYDLV